MLSEFEVLVAITLMLISLLEWEEREDEVKIDGVETGGWVMQGWQKEQVMLLWQEIEAIDDVKGESRDKRGKWVGKGKEGGLVAEGFEAGIQPESKGRLDSFNTIDSVELFSFVGVSLFSSWDSNLSL